MNIDKMHVSQWVSKYVSLIEAGGEVLDVACGEGRHTRLLFSRGYKTVAVDKTLSGVKDLKDNAQIHQIQADLELGEWPFTSNCFAGIIVTNYLHRPLFPCLIDSLARGGVLVYETFAAGNEKYGRPHNPDYLLQENELLQAFAPHLDVIAFEQSAESQPSPGVRQRICCRLP